MKQHNGIADSILKMGILWFNRGWCLLLLMTVANIQGHPSKKRTYIEIFYHQNDVTLQEAQHKCYMKDEHLYLPMLNTTAKTLLYKTLKSYSQSSYGSSTFEFWTNATSDGTTYFWDNYPNCTELPRTSSLWANTLFHSENAAYFKVESNIEYGLYPAFSTETMGMVICEKKQESCEYIGESSDECPSPSTESNMTVVSGLNEIRKCSEQCDYFMSGEAECWGFLYSDTTTDCTLLYHINPLLLTHIETNSNCPSSYPDDIKFFKKKCHFVNFDSGRDSLSSSVNLRNTCTTALTFVTTSSSTTSTTTTTTDQTRTTTTASRTTSATIAPTTTSTATSSTTMAPPTIALKTTTLPTKTFTTMAPPTSTTTKTTATITMAPTTSSTTLTPTPTTRVTTTNSSLTLSLTTATISAPLATASTSTMIPTNTTVAQTNMTSTTLMLPVFATTATTSTTAISNTTDTSFSTTIPLTTTLPSTLPLTTNGVSHFSSAINPTMLYIRSCLCSSQSSSNLTIEERINVIFWELTIDASQTSATIRSKTSAEDERSSSVSIGIVSIVLLIVPTVLMVLMDFSRLCAKRI